MQPLSDCPDPLLAGLRGVLADIDDTITTQGRLRAEAYAAMEAIQSAGLLMIPVTGRPAGWCDHIARMWPVDAVVGENGAFWFRYDHGSRRMLRRYARDEHTRQADAARLRAVADAVLAAVPAARIAADQSYREADLAIDFCEDVDRLPERQVDRIVEVMQAHGLTVKVSSIHVNGWFGDYDKLTTALHLLTEHFDAGAAVSREFGYIGDSPNDEPMFAHFACSVGVANVAEFIPRMRALPAYVTLAPGGAGFAEFARRLVRAHTR